MDSAFSLMAILAAAFFLEAPLLAFVDAGGAPLCLLKIWA